MKYSAEFQEFLKEENINANCYNAGLSKKAWLACEEAHKNPPGFKTVGVCDNCHWMHMIQRYTKWCTRYDTEIETYNTCDEHKEQEE